MLEKKLLYHFTTTKTAIEHILGSPFDPEQPPSLRLGSVKHMNDPRETEPLNLPWQGEPDGSVSSTLSKVQAIQLLSRTIINEAPRLVCFSEDRPDSLATATADEGQSAAIIPGYAHDRMWAE